MWLLNSKGYKKKKKSCSKHWTKLAVTYTSPISSEVLSSLSFTKVDMRLDDGYIMSAVAGILHVIIPEMYRHKRKRHIQIIIKQAYKEKHRLTQYSQTGHERRF